MPGLEEYRRKRNFQRTPEPAGPDVDEAMARAGTESGGQYVIQKHEARRLHYDLRLEQDGVFRSWAVPKGPSLEPGEKRLAVEVEDHPLEYGDFEGVIPEKEYGGGTVMLWDRGRWAPLKPQGRKKADANRIDFVLAGEKLRGAWTLVRTAGRKGDDKPNWLLIKRHDSAAGESQVTDLSVSTGRTMKEIATDKNRTWTRAGETGAVDIEPPDPKALQGARKKALPKTPSPALATLVSDAPVGDDWLHEIKFDGYRILARCDKGKVRLISRNGRDWTRRFAKVAKYLQNLVAEDAVLDGEIVAFSPDGTTSFRDLQEAIASENTDALVYQVFDLIHLNGYDLSATPLTERKQSLADLLAASGFTANSGVRYTDHLQGQGPEFVEHACKLSLEGIISKRADSRYRSARTRDWQKVKCTGREELVICGYTDPGGARTGFGSLLLGGWDGDDLVYAGRVGTGFSDRVLAQLHDRLKGLEVKQSRLVNPPNERGLHWVEPDLVAEVEFTEWTRDGVLRHPAFRGLREDKDPAEVRLPDAARASAPPKPAKAGKSFRPPSRNRRGTVDVAGVTLTNPDRILYPEQGITKLALAQYYEEIADWILPQIAFRPLSLVRCPEGHTGECFFQKHPRSTMSKTIPRVLIDEKEGPESYLYVESLPDIIALVQTGALELHLWGSRVEDVERPDILVFDLDPSPDVPLAETLRVARNLRDQLADLGLEAFPRTTGGKGLHLVVPVIPERRWEEIKAFCHAVAQWQAREDRTRVTANMAKTRRRGRIFIDYLRNGRGATAIGSYSTRARSGAPVAVPLAWDELTPAMQPDRYKVENLRRRLGALRADPWRDFEKARRRLTADMLQAVGVKNGGEQ